MSALTEMRRRLRSHPWLGNAALGLTLYTGTLVSWSKSPDHAPWAYAPVLGALICGTLLLQRRWPWAALGASAAGLAVHFMLGGQRSSLDAVPVVVMYTLALRLPRRRAWAVGMGVALLMGAVRAISSGQSWLAPDVLGQVAWFGMATAIGDATRSRRAYVAAVEERARRAEETREEEAERRVMEERLRIARELHDVLAHQIALINVQAQVAAHLLDAEPEQARQALGHVRHAGREALGELRATVGLLRRPGSGEELVAEPSPSLDRLPDLLGSFTGAGQKVDYLLIGDARPLPAPVELAAFRIVQEALTNVSKHAPGAEADVRITYGAGKVVVEVNDDGAGRDGEIALGVGHGLIGMRERALSVEGTFRAGPLRGGGFQVRAVLPVPGEEAA
ncbi:sensor histidine kinase [Nonomuraea pusilla]|uniref:histidine kinase n=1 Tax=Nonomuraea pusilla TaxID=46177 RepID=A0A1H7TGQ0_9ACTN|nr:sensor histidine kinase [Nonomuraea pusilla]SEL83838.1 Signal transduction histidine kinase [Nonomuraea pusilla]